MATVEMLDPAAVIILQPSEDSGAFGSGRGSADMMVSPALQPDYAMLFAHFANESYSTI